MRCHGHLTIVQIIGERLYFILFRGVMLFRSGPAHQNDFPIYTAKAASKKMIPPLGSGIW